MSITIIKPGIAPRTVYRGTCQYCGCEVQAEEEDVYQGSDGSTVECPTPRCTPYPRSTMQALIVMKAIRIGPTLSSENETPTNKNETLTLKDESRKSENSQL